MEAKFVLKSRIDSDQWSGGFDIVQRLRFAMISRTTLAVKTSRRSIRPKWRRRGSPMTRLIPSLSSTDNGINQVKFFSNVNHFLQENL